MLGHPFVNTSLAIQSLTVGFILGLALKWSFLKSLMGGSYVKSDNVLYGLDHAVLNANVTLGTMWMNMGYWETEKNFPGAARALTLEVLRRAGLDPLSEEPERGAGHQLLAQRRVLDIGFGCGDQILIMAEIPALAEYIGLTTSYPQLQYTQVRLSHLLDCPSETQEQSRFSIFLEDAAEPELWRPEVLTAITRLSFTNHTTNTEAWMLGLDVFYHLKPSREPLFKYAYSHLHGSIAAFDLMLASPGESGAASGWASKLILFLISQLGSMPYTNFITIDEYMAQLVTVGYDSNDIEVTDITEHVFTPLADFLERRDVELQTILGTGIGKFKISKWMFRWFASNGLVRAKIVIARYR
jgi:hypothetical protein